MNKPGLQFENSDLNEYDIVGISMLIKRIAVRINAFALLIFSRPLKPVVMLMKI